MSLPDLHRCHNVRCNARVGQIQYVKNGNASNFGATVALQSDKLTEMICALRAPYKQCGKVGWVLNLTSAGVVRKFKFGATTDSYVWQEGISAGDPAMLLGHPVWLDENMPDLGADTFPIAFGNWEMAYKIVEKAGIRMLRDPFTSKPNFLFYAFRRVGCGLANSETIRSA